ncbi:hypothetical protein ABZX51_007465 [Aspergillus tubingensis]
MAFAWKAAGLTYDIPLALNRLVCSGFPTDVLVDFYSYNRYLTVAARAVRRSLKDGPRAAAERRGNMDLRFAKWEVRICTPGIPFAKFNGMRTVLTDYRVPDIERQAG